MPEFLKVDRPRLLPDLDVRGGLRAGVEGNVDSFPAVEHDGRQVLVEEGLEDDDFVARLDERGECSVLAYMSDFVVSIAALKSPSQTRLMRRVPPSWTSVHTYAMYVCACDGRDGLPDKVCMPSPLMLRILKD